MTFLEHLAELRKHMIIIFGTVFSLFVFFFTFGFRLIEVYGISMAYPYPTMEDSFSAFVFRNIWDFLVPAQVEGTAINPYASFYGGVMTLVYMSFFLAIMFSMPLILWELGKFFKPALKPNEKRIIVKTIIPATFLFILGCMFAFFIIIPFTIKFLLQLIVGLDSQALITVDSFMKFIILFTLAFGLAFELPVIMYGLSRLGIVSSKFWRRNWRYAFIVFIIFGGVITPDGSGITQLMIAVPMLGLYFCGYAAVIIKERNNKK